MIVWTPEQWDMVRSAIAAWGSGAHWPQVDDRCVNEGGLRADGTFCRERAEPNGWCEQCWSELAPWT